MSQRDRGMHRLLPCYVAQTWFCGSRQLMHFTATAPFLSNVSPWRCFGYLAMARFWISRHGEVLDISPWRGFGYLAMARFWISRHGEVLDISPWRGFRYLAMARLTGSITCSWLAPLRGASHS